MARMGKDDCPNKATEFYIIKSSVFEEKEYFACCFECANKFNIFVEHEEVAKEEFIVGSIMNS